MELVGLGEVDSSPGMSSSICRGRDKDERTSHERSVGGQQEPCGGWNVGPSTQRSPPRKTDARTLPHMDYVSLDATQALDSVWLYRRRLS